MYLNDELLDVQLLGSAPEEIACINGFIDKKKLAESAKSYRKSLFGEHLMAVARGRVKY